MHAVRSRWRLAVGSVLVIATMAIGSLTFRHVQRGMRASELISAVYAGNRRETQQLLDKGYGPNSPNLSGLTPLMRSVTVPPQLANPEVVQLLLWYGADPNLR